MTRASSVALLRRHAGPGEHVVPCRHSRSIGARDLAPIPPHAARFLPLRGMTRRAFSNHSSVSSGAASGLLAIWAAMSSSVRESNQARFSGVAQALAAALASSIDTRLVFSDFLVIGFPETDDPPHRVAPGIYHDAYPAIKQRDRSGRDDPRFAIIVATVFFFDEGALEDQRSELQRQPVLLLVVRILHGIELDVLHYSAATPACVNMSSSGLAGGSAPAPSLAAFAFCL